MFGTCSWECIKEMASTSRVGYTCRPMADPHVTIVGARTDVLDGVR